MADAPPRGRGRARGRTRGPPQPAPQPAPVPAAVVRPAASVSASSSSGGPARPPIGRAARPPQRAAGDLASRVSGLSVGGNNGNGSNGSNGGNGSNGNGKPIGRGAVRPARETGQVLITKPPGMGPKQGAAGEIVKLTSNYFELKTTNVKWSLCKHHVDVSPQEDRTFMKKILMRQHQQRFQGYLFDGSTLFTFQNACPDGKPLELVSQNKEGQNYTLTIKFVGTVERTDYQYLQVFNIILRECQFHLKLELMRRNYYDPQAKIEIPEHRLELWPGYNTSVMQCEHTIMLQAEITYKVLRRDTAYDVLQSCLSSREGSQNLQQAYSAAMIGAIIITRYNNKTYRVDEVDYTTFPTSTFPQTRRGETTNVRYTDYFQQRYNVRINDTNQPMLISRSNAKARRAGQPELLYLVPELCVMTGMTDAMRGNFHLMKAVAVHTCVNPGNRMSRLRQFNSRLNNIPEVRAKLSSWGLELNRDLIQIPGRILPAEKIFVGDGRSYDAGRDANWDRNLRSNKMLHSVNITNWVMIFPARSSREAKEFFQTLQKVASGMRYTIDAPKPYEIANDRAGDYTSALDRAINERNPQIVMCVVTNNRADRYNVIKKKCILDKPVPSQVVLYKTITSKGVMSIATKVAIQMNCKVGGAPWAVEIPMKGLMTVGYDVCHQPGDKRLSYGAMVATLDSQCIRWYSNVTRHSAGEELSKNFAMNIQMAVGRYKDVNEGNLPNVILVFRDGVGEGQIEYVLKHEVEQMKAALQPEYTAAEKPLRLCFIIVTKRINTRIFKDENNPPPGTIVDDVITDPHRFDFYLISQSVRQGTVSPTHYNCIENSASLKSDHVQRIAYKFTHLYYNWSGTVRVPAPCQYAHKLAFLTAQSLGQSHSNLDRLLYYL